MLRDIKIVAKDVKMMPKDFKRCQKTFRDAQKLKRHPVTQYDVLRLAYIMIGGLSYKSLPHISRITIKKQLLASSQLSTNSFNRMAGVLGP